MNTSLKESRPYGILLVLTAGCCWGFHGILIKKAFTFGASFQQVFLLETLFATLFFLFFKKSLGAKDRPKTNTQWRDLLICGAASMGIGTFLFLSFSLGPVAIGATLLFLYLPQVYGYSVLSGIQGFSYSKAFAILLLLIGAGITTNIIGAFQGRGYSGAVFAALAASVCYAIIFLFTPRLAEATSATFRSFSISFVCFVGSAAMLLAFPIVRNQTPIDWAPLAGLAIILGFFGQTLPIITLMKGIPLVGGSLAGALASIELPIAVLCSAIFLGETVGIHQMIGVALVFIGIILFNLSKETTSPKTIAA
ncbi:MAG: DMT family transporter [Verrucomicrobiota bacterium]